MKKKHTEQTENAQPIDKKPEQESQEPTPEKDQADNNEPISIDSADLEKIKKADEYFDQLLRLQAEFDNYRKRVNKERVELHKYANEKLLGDILPIFDNFQRSLTALEEHVTSENHKFYEGVELIYKQLSQLLKQNGIEELESVGQQFDPRFHEALQQIESAEHPENTVVTEISKGYMLNERLLRPAAVIVSKQPAAE